MRRALDRLSGLYVLADDDPRWKLDPFEQARAALLGGACAVQLRAKHATDGEALRWAEAIAPCARERGALLLVNDRFDLALAAGADGVHLGQDDLPPARIPAAARERLLVGYSTHTAEQVERARGEPVDYLAFGPVFGTTSKASEWDARGTEALRDAVQRAAPRPLVAIGGVDATNAADCIRAGARAVCVLSAVAGAGDPVPAARALARAVAEAAG